jgi:nucleoside-diphosphate-sugar epimerase
MDNKNLLICGASGYVGSNLTQLFLENNYNVYSLYRTRGLFPSYNQFKHTFFPICTSLDKINSLGNSIPDIDSPIIINCMGKSRGSMQELWNSNIMCTKSALDLSVSQNSPLFIHFSTGGIYGNSAFTPRSELDPLLPYDVYTKTKFISERIVNMYAETYGLICIILRLYFPYGGNNQKGLFKFISDSVLNQSPIKINNNSCPLISCINIQDIYNAILSLIKRVNLEKKGVTYIFNLCSDEIFSIAQVTNIFSKLYFKEPVLEYTGINVGSYMGLNTSLKNYCGWSPKNSLYEIKVIP